MVISSSRAVAGIERHGHHMGRAQPPSAEASTLWLMALIEAMDEVAATPSQACESSVIRVFGNRLDLPAMPIPPPNTRWLTTKLNRVG